MVGWVWLQNIRAPPPPPAPHTWPVCVPHRDTVLSLYSRYTVCIQHKYSVYKADIWIVNTAECQIWRKIMKNALNQVQMAPFGLIFDRGESYRV